jgi:hypothetical protein
VLKAMCPCWVFSHFSEDPFPFLHSRGTMNTCSAQHAGWWWGWNRSCLQKHFVGSMWWDRLNFLQLQTWG